MIESNEPNIKKSSYISNDLLNYNIFSSFVHSFIHSFIHSPSVHCQRPHTQDVLSLATQCTLPVRLRNLVWLDCGTGISIHLPVWAFLPQDIRLSSEHWLSGTERAHQSCSWIINPASLIRRPYLCRCVILKHDELSIPACQLKQVMSCLEDSAHCPLLNR